MNLICMVFMGAHLEETEETALPSPLYHSGAAGIIDMILDFSCA
jgi:hypothetical protein